MPVESALERPMVNLASNLSHDAGAVMKGAADEAASVVARIELPHDQLSIGQELSEAGSRLAQAVKGPDLSPEAYTHIAIAATDQGDIGSAHEYFSKAIDRTRSASGALKILDDMKVHMDTAMNFAINSDTISPGYLNLLKEGLTKAAQTVKTPEELNRIVAHANYARDLAARWEPSINGFGDQPNFFSSAGAMFSGLLSLGGIPMARKALMVKSIDNITDFAVQHAAANAQTPEAAREISRFAESGRRYGAAEAALEQAKALEGHK